MSSMGFDSTLISSPKFFDKRLAFSSKRMLEELISTFPLQQPIAGEIHMHAEGIMPPELVGMDRTIPGNATNADACGIAPVHL